MTASWPAPVLALVILSASVLVAAGPVVAGPVPDYVQLALMRRAIAETPLVHVGGEFGTLKANRPWLDSSGVRLERLGGRHNAMRTSVVNADRIELIPWQQISSIQTDRAGTAAACTLVGGLTGFLFGGAVAESRVDLFSLRDQTDQANRTLAVWTGGGLALGYLIGQHKRKRTIYPPASSDGR